MKITIQKFYRVNGGSTQYKGVEPDIVFPTLFDHLKTGERSLDYSLPWDRIKPVDYTPYSGAALDFDRLRNQSFSRAEKNEGLKIIKEETKKAKKRSDETVLSININEMREKREEALLVREKVGAHYRKFRKEIDENIGKSDQVEKGSNETDPAEVWLKDVNADPYIREATNIIEDIRNL